MTILQKASRAILSSSFRPCGIEKLLVKLSLFLLSVNSSIYTFDSDYLKSFGFPVILISKFAQVKDQFL